MFCYELFYFKNISGNSLIFRRNCILIFFYLYQNNSIMNQILNMINKEKIKKFFKIQLIISIVCIVFGVIYLIVNIKEKEKQNNISNIVSLNARLNSVFSKNIVEEKSIYFGRIICDKIDLDYYIYNEYSKENLEVLPCKFSGGNIGEETNICIIGHNYFDNRFFSNLNKLEIEDIVILNDLNDNSYEYQVYKKFEINENDIESVIKQEFSKELTLCTCTYNKEQRLVVKAKI